MICSSLKRLRRMVLLLIEGPNLSLAGIQGSTSILTDHSTTDGEGWFYTQGGQRKGPFSADELHKLLAARTIDGETPIWRKDQSGWQPLLHDRGRCAAQGYSAARRPRHLNNGFVWALAVAPIAYLFMHVAILHYQPTHIIQFG
jgi:hypothetical protein